MKRITREYVRDNPDKIFVFGDNLKQRGMGGQAKEMRGEPNSIGIVTKKKPSNTPDSYFTDEEYDINCQEIDKCFFPLEQIDKDITIVIPENGIGTGLAELDERAPKTFAYLQRKMMQLIAYHVTHPIDKQKKKK